MAPPQSVGAAEGNDFLVVEAHAVEDVAEVCNTVFARSFGAIGQPTVGRGRFGALVDASFEKNGTKER